MATIALHRDEFEENKLPPLCIRCGEPATCVKKKTFTWGPDWLLILLFVSICFGPLFWVALILNLVVRKRMKVPVPLCQKHRNHWLPLQVVLFGGIGLVVLLFTTVVILLLTATHPNSPNIPLAGWFALGTLLTLVIVLFPAAILQKRVIRATLITDYGIWLRGVASEFSDTVEERRRVRPPYEA
jgi:hypothetical protein